ncbi:MAG TPA: TIR domain-containing protein [Thermoanaerobaculia bacterium]|nr:TIR domain-containing protein [Thermoanaerobaculia bacterium]
MRHTVYLPPIGPDIREVTITSVVVRVGASLRPREMYMSAATDKIDVELEIEYAAVVLEILVHKGEVVPAGGPVLVVETVDDPAFVERSDEIANIEIGLRYLGSRDPVNVCSRPELRSYAFSEFEVFVGRAATVARQFRGIDLLSLDKDLVDELRAVLFQLTKLVSQMDGFRPESLDFAVLDEQQLVKWDVGVRSEEAQSRFERLLDRAKGVLQPQDAPFVFVSYSHHDQAFVVEFTQRLTRRGIQYFLYERDVDPGHSIVQRVHDELKRASHALVLISEAGIQSRWVAYEIGYARGRDIAVVPYLLTPGLALPSYIAGYRYLKLDEEEVFLDRLAKFGRDG